MNEQEYLQQRVSDQINWYSKKSTTNKKFYQTFKTFEIILSVTIPFLTGYVDAHPEIKYLIGVMSLLIAFIAGIMVVYKFHEKWLDYRITSEGLIQEKYMFLAKSGPYKTDPSLNNLVERIELMIAKQNGNWSKLMSQQDKPDKDAQGNPDNSPTTSQQDLPVPGTPVVTGDTTTQVDTVTSNPSTQGDAADTSNTTGTVTADKQNQ